MGKVVKVSVSLPEDVLAELRERVGPGGVSAYVTRAVERDLAVDRLAELLAELEAEFGPVSEEGIARARAEWYGE